MKSNRSSKTDETVHRMLDSLEEGIRRLREEKSYKDWLRCMSKFHKYSFNNQLLIATQNPNATLVAGYSTWKKLKRQVRKGEHGIRIFAPMRLYEKVDPQTPDLGGEIPESGGEPLPKLKSVAYERIRFTVVTVFDISQTDGDPLPESPCARLTGDAENYDELLNIVIAASPVSVKFGNDLKDGVLGRFSRATDDILIRDDLGQKETLNVLIHEIAHATLHRTSEEMHQRSRNERELEAESVAYVVCEHLGIDTSDRSFAYISIWNAGKELSTLRKMLENVRSASCELIDRIDNLTEQTIRHTEEISQEIDFE